MKTQVLVLLLVPSTLVASEPRGPNRALRPTGAPASPVERTLDAAGLALAGRASVQPELLAAAASLLAGTNVKPSLRAKRTEGGTVEGAKASWSLDPARLLEEAVGTARKAGQADLERHLASTALKPVPGGTGRALAQTERVATGAADLFEIAFEGGVIAQVGVLGAGSSDLDLTVLDDQWNVVCAASSDTAREYCSWVPAATGTFRVRVKNQGPAADDYLLVTN